jgi:glutathione S-transferase
MISYDRRMTNLLLYDNPVSSNALKARFALAELGLSYEKRDVPLTRPRPDWYMSVNPFGRVPTLVDGELVLPESNAILRYLASRERRDDLYPVDAVERAPVDYLLDAWSTQIRPALFRLEQAALFHRDADRGGGRWEEGDPAAIEAARPGAEAMLDVFESVLAGNGTVLGRFTVVDLAVGPVLWRTKRLPLELARWPKAYALREAIELRSSFQAAGPLG